MQFLQRVKRWLGLGTLPLYESAAVFDDRPWDAECESALDELVEDAEDTGQVITVCHLLRALCSQLPLEEAYGPERAARFVSLLDEEILRTRRDVPDGHQCLVDRYAALLVEVAFLNRKKEDDLITTKGLAGLALNWPAQPRRTLTEAGFEIMPLLRWVTHDTLSVLSSWQEGGATDESYELYLLNDDMTSQKLVTTLLQSHLSMSAAVAETRMLEIHEEGEMLMAVGDFELVAGMAESIQRDARAAGSPLEVQIRPSS